MKGKYISIYEKNHTNKEDERLGLFQRLNENYSIEKALYPGAYAHITPAFVFPVVVFNDVYKKLEPYYDSDEIPPSVPYPRVTHCCMIVGLEKEDFK